MYLIMNLTQKFIIRCMRHHQPTNLKVNIMNTIHTIVTNSFVGAMKSAVAAQPKGESKKGSKKAAFLAYYKDAHKTTSRKAMIAHCVEHLGLTQAGASTYIANARSGEWVIEE